MKQQLRQIYEGLSNGSLSQEEALEKIKAIKLQEQGRGSGALLVRPVWRANGLEASAGAPCLEYTERQVILCELSTVDVEELRALLPDSQCLSLQAGPEKNIAQRYSECALACFERIRSVLQGKPQGKALVQIVVADDEEQALMAGVSGLLKTTALENPQIIGQLVLVPADINAGQLGSHLLEEGLLAQDVLTRYGQSGRQVLGWQEVPADPQKPSGPFKNDGVYLITGGLGALGVLFAKEILDQTRQARVVLTGRSPLSDEKRVLLERLCRQSGRVVYRQVDIGELFQVEQVIAGIKNDYRQLNGILHSAGMIADNFILKKSGAEFLQVLEPKVTGTVNLDQASRDVELDFFVLFSSIVGVMGNVGQADYAAANGFMDQFAAYRNRQVAAGNRHGRTRSINWPLWQAGGMGVDPARLELLQQTTGMQPMQKATGIGAFYRSLALPYDQILAAEGNLAQIRGWLAGRPLQREQSAVLTATPQAGALETGASGMAPESLVEKTEDYLRRQCSDLLKVPFHKIDPQAALEAYGIDSILAMKLTGQLEKTFGALSKTLFFEYQTIRELTAYFIQSYSARLGALFPAGDGNRQGKPVDRLNSLGAPSSAQPRRTTRRRFSTTRNATPVPAMESDPIAIVGLSGRYPEAINIEAYWRNLRDGKDCIIEVPQERWDWRQYFSEDRTQSGRHYSKWGGFIAGVDEFDPLFFNISPKEARLMDPQERLFLQHAWMAIEDAGYTRAALQVPYEQDLAGQVGVYVGVMYTEYQLLGADATARGKHLGVASSGASIANRVSYAFNLHGPSVTLDTMCSSSLTAIHFACQDLKLGRTSLAIAGGVNVSIHPNKYLVLSAGQFISSDGHCQSFGEGGDGYIPGEGVGVVVLKRLSDAKRDGDHIYGIIRGSALNHGGKTNGYTVPNPQAQASAINRALAESHTDARHISYIEAHGTGTKLGDPIEIAALSKAFHQSTPDTEFCSIGSAKSNIGHCESAAGIAGLTKVLLQMQHQQIVPSLHSARLNPHIDFPSSPFVVNQALRSWEQPVVDGRKLPRIAGISSFGAGGSNAHLIVEEYQPLPQPPFPIAPVVILLSARTTEQLQQKARDLMEFVRTQLNSVDLIAMAHTLQVGREAMDERLGFVVKSVEQLVEKLRAYLAGEENIEDAFHGQVKGNKDAMSVFSADVDLQPMIGKWIANGRLSKLVDLWVKGLELDWNRLYGEVKPQRISLPTYPFARERYWIDIAVEPVAPRHAASEVLHPLLHRNTSDLSHQSYSSTFSGEELFLKDHQVDGQTTLPAAAYLEMARVAVEKAARVSQEGRLELRSVVWAQPIVVTQKKQVSIAVLPNGDGQIEYEIYSQEPEQEVVHCQGRAIFCAEPAPAKLDIEQLKGQMRQGKVEADSVYATSARMGLAYGPAFQGIVAIHRGSGQLLAQLRLPGAVVDKPGDYVLHPILMDTALQAAIGLIESGSQSNQARLPIAVDTLRIFSPCKPEMMAWVRYSPAAQTADEIVKLDIDLCDERGLISAQLLGVGWRLVSLDLVEPVLETAALPGLAITLPDIARATPARREIFLVPSTRVVTLPAGRSKPAAISLAAPGELASAEVSSENLVHQSSPARAPISLSRATPGVTGQGGAAAADSPVKLYDDGNGIFSIQIGTSASRQTLTDDVIARLRQALDRVRQEASVKVLMIGGAERCLLGGGRESYNQAVEQNLYDDIVSFPYPVIAVLQGDTIGPGFLFAAMCDFMVCNEDAHYGFTDAPCRLYPTTPETVLFSHRFGDVRAQDLLYLSSASTGSTASTGRQLRAKGWTCPIVPAVQVEAYAQELASRLAAKSQVALRLLKQHLTRHLTGLVRELRPIEATAATNEDPGDSSAKATVSPEPHLRLETPAENVLVITICAANEPLGVKDLVASLGRVFGEIHQNAGYKAIVLASEYPDFLPGTEPGIRENVVLDFRRLLAESRIPVVAALDGNAKGDAWLLSLSCDASVYSQTGVYSAYLGESPVLAQTSAALFAYRFGSDAGREILLTGADYSGAELLRRTGTLTVTEQERVLSVAVKVAQFWAGLPPATWSAWKKHSETAIRETVSHLPSASEGEQKHEVSDRLGVLPAAIPLQSQVVTATAHAGGIVVVKMEDRNARNMFSDALMAGLREAFAHIEQTPAYKVVILTGYDNYFASGGTKESLLAIQAGQAKFTDAKVFQLPVDCKLPVIAAMQGHGVGAGWSLGMFADVVLLSEESRYVSPYMNYGFTPGAGATWSLGEKIGQDLARESLLTAQTYSGSELKDRGLRLTILPRAEVYPAAMALARQIAQTSRQRLIGLKQQWTGEVHDVLEETYRLELAMHEKTFVGQSDTLAQIEKNFHPGIDTLPASPLPPQVEPVKRPADGDVRLSVTASLKTLLANELQMRESDIDENAQFVDLGLDSISGVSWIRKINERYHTAIEATTIYSYPTLAQLSQHVKEEAESHGNLSSAGAAAPPAPSSKIVSSAPNTARKRTAGKLTSWRSRTASRFVAGAPAARAFEPIAVIGMAGQFPQAKNLEEFWRNIAEGRNCITPVPPNRWDVDAHYQPGDPVEGKANSQWAGVLNEYGQFDPLFFNISPTEAENMDPQHRLFLQACWHSIESAGYGTRVLSGSRCGVFVGCAASDYHQLSRQHQLSAQGFTGSATSILAARISYFLNLQGPCVSIDTACSSSLVAIAQACDSLVSGDSDLALAGGVYVMAGPDMHIKTSQAGMLSAEGKCFTFDQRADGFVPGEGVGVVMLKRLADAERDQDIVCGVIEGWGVNQDGKTNGITAPNPESQTRLEQHVYDKFQIDPAGIQLIEAHGTGTKLGDPIEVEGLKKAFKKYTQNKEYCALGSVKSNIGHCLTAAGIAGVIKLLLALEHRQLPPTINFERLNEHIDLKETPFYVNTQLKEWEPEGAQRRQAAISSFGFSGTNAHVVIGEYLPTARLNAPVSVITQNAKIIVPLSARTVEQLQRKALDLLDFIRSRAQSLDLVEIAYTLQVGREVMDERMGFLVSTVEQLSERLRAYINGDREIEDFYQGQIKRAKESIGVISQDDDLKETIVNRWIGQKNLSRLLDFWVKGLELDWDQLYGEVKPRRISLPTYPFAKEHYWIDPPASISTASTGPSSPGFTTVLHSLLHTNTSDFSRQSYCSNFSGSEFFLVDHQVRMNGDAAQKVLPGVAYLEMARAAIAHALPVRPESSILELHNTIWAQPIVIIQNTEVRVALSASDSGEIDYEIFTRDEDKEIVHCQGRGVWRSQAAPARLDIDHLKGQMGQSKLKPDSVYEAWARMGLVYGPSFQGITAIHLGRSQLLAHLRLPKTAVDNAGDCILHPSLMDGALQSCVGLIDSSSESATQPRLPFALETLRILSPCTSEMFVWVRYAPGIQAGDHLIKLDIDLCDDRGNVCVQMHGLSSRALSKETGKLLANPVWQVSSVEVVATNIDCAQHHVILCELPKVNFDKWLSLQAGQQKTIEQRYREYALTCFEQIQTILQAKPQSKVLVQIIVPDHQEQVLLAGLSGLLKTAALENPHFIGQLILVPPQIGAEELARRVQEEKTGSLEPLIKYEQGTRQVLRWQEVAADSKKTTSAFREDGVYLITGGLGGLGVLFAKEILEQTRRAQVVLTGRSARPVLTTERQALLDGLSAEAGRAIYRQVELSDLDQVRQLIACIQDEYSQLNGILHSAGMIADNFILKKTSAEFSDVLAPKVTGTFNLDQASRDVELDFFVLFSSIAGAMGNLGQADYATANGFMDQFAAYRNRQVAAKQRHGRTRSINWPLWQAGGIVIDPASQGLLQQATGMRPMQTATGLQAFYRSLALPCDQTLVGEGDLAEIRRALLTGPALPAESQEEDAAVVAAIGLEDLAGKTQDYLRKQLSGLLKLPAHKIDPEAALENYGIDSILAMKLTNQLEKTFGSLSKTLFFEYQTIRELGHYFIQSHPAQLATLFASPGNGGRQTKPVDTRPRTLSTEARPISRFSRPSSAAPKPTESDAIAIIGLSGRYPEAIDIDAYWENLRGGKDCITEVPRERWDWREYFSEDRTLGGNHYSKWGGFIAGVDEFDPLFFNISPKEAKFIDPQERLFLQHAWMAMEDAGYTRAGLQLPDEQDLPGQVGVYAGVMYTEYQLFGAEASAHGKRMGVAGSAASIANRVSYALNLHGPSMTLDTMCSSSLSAIHLACQDLKLGRTSLAIAGGVNVSIHPNKYLVLSAGQFISSDGHCQSFGEGGDGYIPGEGVGVVVLKRLSEAKRDDDHIYGIIRGSALTHGGKTNGYSVPNPHAQTSAISRALTESHIDARRISYIEAHGTGTKLGDPIEIAALSKAFHQYTEDTGFCPIGSAKSNIGHCESAAGIAGLTKVLLQMQHRQIVPSLHSAQLNPHIDFLGSPFVVNQSLQPWEQPVIDGEKQPRIAGISSFGAGGSNAHLIVEEYQPPAQEPLTVSTVVILLSARTPEQLQQKAHDLLNFVRTRLNRIDLVAMAYTLQMGREAMDERLGFVVSSAEQLAERLKAWVNGEQGIEDAYQGQVKRNKDTLSLFRTDADLQQTIDKWLVNKKLSRLAELWVKGLELDWSKLYGDVKPQHVSLPTYPFARERYWLDIAASEPLAARRVATAALHPLLHSNTSDLSEQRYRSTFTGNEFFFTDQKALPVAAYLEMARAAIEHALPERTESAVLELCNTVWPKPVTITENQPISVALFANDDDEIDYEIYSQDGNQAILHCQGRAVLSHQATPAGLDIEQIKQQMTLSMVEPNTVYVACARMGLGYGPELQAIEVIRQGNNQLLAHLSLPAKLEPDARDYVLHPSLMNGALQASVGLLGGSSEGSGSSQLSFSLESLRIISACTRDMVAWVRYSPGSQAGAGTVRLDIDLCDEQGHVCAQMRGICWQDGALDFVKPVPAVQQRIPNPAPTPREIAFIAHKQLTPVPVERRKPAGISLAAPSTAVSSEYGMRQFSAGRPPITLSSQTQAALLESEAIVSSLVRLYDGGEGVFTVQVAESAGSHPVKDAIAHMRQALERVKQEASVKVLMIIGPERCFLNGGRENCNAAVEQQLYNDIVSFPYPAIAVLPGDTGGAGFLFAALCDFMVCNEDAHYGYTDAPRHLYPTTPETVLFSHRFGDVRAQDFLYLSSASMASTGRQLRAKGWTCPIVPSAQVEPYAQELASTLATKSQVALRLLKQHLTRHLTGLVRELTPIEAGSGTTNHPSDMSAKTIVSPAKHLRLDTPAENVLAITFCAANEPVGVTELVADLGHVFAGIHQNAGYKAIVLASEYAGFLPATEQAIPENVVLEFQRLVVESRIPVVAALDGNAKGDAWLLGLFCDATVYCQTGVYSSARLGESPLLAQTAAATLAFRFGSETGREILLTGADYAGGELLRRTGTVMVREQDRVLSAAVKVAEFWARLPQAMLTAWKKHTATEIHEPLRLVQGTGWEQKDEVPDLQPVAPQPIPLQSQVVTATAYAGGIVVVKMEDRHARNMFSDALMAGLREAFAYIEQSHMFKVVILTGYDNYFASGGTKESLLAIQAGQAKFTDAKVFQLPLDCKLPVIAAMQGHGIGAGWSLGMFADFVLLSEESRYVSPYMNYGFTPGAGATWSLGEKIGHDLARESLLTAQTHAGSELKDRGLKLSILPRAEVYPAAMALARQIVQSSRQRLIGLKQQWTAHLHGMLEETYRLELAMHEETFVGHSATLAQIEKNFNSGIDTLPAGPLRPQVERAVNLPTKGAAQPGVTASLKTLLANELQMRESDIDENAQFVDLGLDSISGVSWIRKINEKYHTSIEATKVYSYPTLAELSHYVKEEAELHGALTIQQAPAAAVEVAAASSNRGPSPLNSNSGTEPAPAHRRSRRASRFTADAAPAPRDSQPIAVIGMAGQFPQAKNLEEFWRNIADGRNCIIQVPSHRWDVSAYYQPGDAVAGKSNSQWVGALEEYDRFDPLFFNISPTEAESMDPQQRLFLQACWHSIENAGYDARVLSGSKCGVFAGCATSDYHQLSRQHQLSAQGFTGSATSILAARISYFLNLQGPCVSIDTACSSSLVAIAQACDSLVSGGSDLALAGGVCVMAGPEMHIKTSQAGMLSPEGKCFTFDQRADGIVPGEGVGVVMLKRLADAQRDQDIIYGVIQGWGVNQDGRTNGITAPNPESQTRLEQDVYDKYHIDPAGIQLIEAHGTGTKLGDPIEVEALKKAFKKYTQNQEYCALGSVKSNIGHCLTAAGIAGVMKLLLALNHEQLPPTINFDQLNEHIDLKDSPFYVNQRLQPWPGGNPQGRQAAISAFGFSGTNAHMVIGEYLPPAAIKRQVVVVSPDTKTIIPLSARTPAQLQQKASDLLDFIRRRTHSVNLTEIAYTLQVGRVAMDERLGFVVNSVEELTDKLQAYIRGEQGIKDAHQGQVKRGKESLSGFGTDLELQRMVDQWIAGRQLSSLLDIWAKGLELNWNELYGELKPPRISLPEYPFAKERYWIDAATSQLPAATGPAMGALHPLLHRNTSDLIQHRYSSTFTSAVLSLADHAGQKVLPPVACLEMARAAVEHALPNRLESTVLELHNTVWAQPIVIVGNTQVSIALSPNDNQQIDYEIYSHDADHETVHCQGRALLSDEPAPHRLDIERLEGQMSEGQADPESVYTARARMGLVDGPAFQAITAIYRATGQVLAQLSLPRTVADNARDYVLHPSLVDGALQAALTLLDTGSNQARLPLALEKLRIVSPCTPEMVAWARYSPGSQAADHVVRLDIDVCDEQGNVCVQMHGLSLGMLPEIRTTARPTQAVGQVLANPVWHMSGARVVADKFDYTEHHVILCELSTVSVHKLKSLVPHSQCLSLQVGEQNTMAQRYSEYALACFERIRTILQSKPQSRVLLQIVIADHRDQMLAGLSGLLKTAALEHLQFIGQLILVAQEITAEELARLVQEEKTSGLDGLIKYERGERQVLRWQEATADLEKTPIAFKDNGVYLITGGLGGLGLLFAKEILEQTRGAHVVLTGRAPLTERQAILDGLFAGNGRVGYRQVELDDLEHVQRLIAAIRDEYRQLNGILHCAGMTADNFIVKKGGAEFSQVLAPKVTGSFNLDQASQDVELDFFVLFSSIAAAMGNPGQADYAAANGFMDQFAAYRNRLVDAQRRHGATRSINWTLWQAGGMNIDSASRELLQQTAGVQPLQTATGLQAFYRSLRLPYDQILVVEGIEPKITTYLQKARLFEPAASTEGVVSRQSPDAETEPAVSLDQLQQQLKNILACVLRIETSIIDVDQPFVEVGLDSFLGAELIVAINKKYKTELSHMRLFDYSTVREFSLFLEQEIRKLPGYAKMLATTAGKPPLPVVSSFPILKKKSGASLKTTGAKAHSDDKIAIIGMSGRYPKANDLGQYWDNLVKGRNSIDEVPASRWDVNRYYDPNRARKDKTYSKWLGALDDIDCFDPLFFRISPQEAEYMDPQHRLFLQESYKAFEDAGYSVANLSNTKCGVYLGISTSEYLSLLSRHGVPSAPVTSNSYAIAAARIAYYLNLKGPAISVDTACSSSLVAIHLACQAILNREIDMALAGGVSLWLNPESYVAMSQAGMFSPTGQCKTFDDTADGIVNGEGVGALVLKRLTDALQDGDLIYGVILGSGINQDGRTNGITAPSVNSQIELERSIYARYGIDPETISYVETHGTGTKLGDPIELEALGTVFKERTARKHFCALGSVKSNIGHTTAAAGVAGLQKVLLSMRHRTLVPSLNVTRENSRFDFKDSPFYISRQAKAWDVTPGSVRRAAVSSFGFSGTNAHLVIEEYPLLEESSAGCTENDFLIVPLSARTSEQLRQKSRDLLAFIRAAQQPLDLVSVAYTLQIGREVMEERLGFVVSSIDQLAEKLSAYVNGEKSIDGVYQGRVEPGGGGMAIIGRDDDMREAIDKWIARKKHTALLDLWIRGLNFDWNKLYGGVKPRRISLPAYPFAKERCWIDKMGLSQELDSELTLDANMRSIEDIINQIDDDAMDTGNAVQALKMLV